MQKPLVVHQGLHASVGQGSADGTGGRGACVVIDNHKFHVVDEEDLNFKKISPMAEEHMGMLREDITISSPPSRVSDVLWRDYVRVVARTDDEDSDSKLLIPTLCSDESKNENGQRDKGIKVMKDKFRLEQVCEEDVPLNNNIGKQSGDLKEMPSEAV
nr:hypothetical protein [Tanacetum cinerariifolium]